MNWRAVLGNSKSGESAKPVTQMTKPMVKGNSVVSVTGFRESTEFMEKPLKPAPALNITPKKDNAKSAPLGLVGNQESDALDRWIARDYAKRKAEFDRVKAAVLAHKDGTK